MRDGAVGHHRVDDRLVALRDVMPTLLTLSGNDVPGHCEGMSMVGSAMRDHVSCLYGTGNGSTRMVRDERSTD